MVDEDLESLRNRIAALETELAASNQRFQLVEDCAPAFLVMADASGLINYVSKTWHVYAGAPVEDVLGEGWLNFTHPGDRPAVLAARERSLASGVPLDVEVRLRSADGSYGWWRAIIAPRRDAQGAVEQWVGLVINISQDVARREQQAALRERLQLQAERATADRDLLWTLAGDVFMVVAFDGTILTVNPAATQVFGWSETEMVGRNRFELIHPDDLARVSDANKELTRGRSLGRFLSRWRHKNGSYRSISWVAVPSPDRIVAVGRDLTLERQQAEALQQAEEQLRQAAKMDAVGQLTGGLAHDFNNLLMTVQGSLELLHEQLDEGRLDGAKDLANSIGAAASRAAALTHRLLAFSRRQTLDPQLTDVNQLVLSMEDMVRRTVGPSIALTVSVAPDLWRTLVDPNQLESALLNLCLNARDAMPAGGQLRIETVNETLEAGLLPDGASPGPYICLKVRDTGIGMSPEVAARAFDPFFTTKPLGFGTGLGLSMTYGFARQSGGHVRLDSTPGRGTTVLIWLPRHGGPEHQPATVQRPKAAVAREGEVILLVDDDASVRSLVGRVLSRIGYLVHQAAEGPSALDVLSSDKRIDLLVSDVGLPGPLNGRQVAEAARALRPGLKVLFITGYAAETIGPANLGGETAVLTKPFSLAALSARVREMIG